MYQNMTQQSQWPTHIFCSVTVRRFSTIWSPPVICDKEHKIIRSHTADYLNNTFESQINNCRHLLYKSRICLNAASSAGLEPVTVNLSAHHWSYPLGNSREPRKMKQPKYAKLFFSLLLFLSFLTVFTCLKHGKQSVEKLDRLACRLIFFNWLVFVYHTPK